MRILSSRFDIKSGPTLEQMKASLDFNRDAGDESIGRPQVRFSGIIHDTYNSLPGVADEMYVEYLSPVTDYVYVFSAVYTLGLPAISVTVIGEYNTAAQKGEASMYTMIHRP